MQQVNIAQRLSRTGFEHLRRLCVALSIVQTHENSSCAGAEILPSMIGLCITSIRILHGENPSRRRMGFLRLLLVYE